MFSCADVTVAIKGIPCIVFIVKPVKETGKSYSHLYSIFPQPFSKYFQLPVPVTVRITHMVTEGYVSGLRAVAQQPANRTHNPQLHTIPTT